MAIELTPEWGQEYIRPAFAGDEAAASDLISSLHDHQRAQMVRIMYDAGVPPDAFRVALTGALDQTHCYGDVLQAAKTRLQLVRWCRYARYKLPASCNDKITIFRGVGGGSIARAKAGLSWTLDFDCAAWFAMRLNGAEPLVLEATVPASEAVFYSSERSESEAIPATIPKNLRFHQGENLRLAHDRYQQTKDDVFAC
ncbi:MAG: hypothetical protein P4L50_23405 [Anaerolineaceae bacterium]|nr:hypothetical protein [Anaerolineaceae bacterium]